MNASEAPVRYLRSCFSCIVRPYESNIMSFLIFAFCHELPDYCSIVMLHKSEYMPPMYIHNYVSKLRHLSDLMASE